jgi:hypothetical protein
MKIYTHDNIPEGVVNIPDSYISTENNNNNQPTLIHLNPLDYSKLIKYLKEELMDLDKMRRMKEEVLKIQEREKKIVRIED